MVKINSVQCLYFSPTGTTKKTVSTIAENTGLKSITPIDLTLPQQRTSFTGKIQGDLLVVGAPVYGGSPPWPMLEPLNKLEGDGKWAVPVAVYGNRAAETCVEEMAKILRGRGFKILAGASFVAEHSLRTPNYRIAYGRPDNADMEIICSFVKQIGVKGASPSEIQLSDKLYNFRTREYVDSFPEDYHWRVLDSLKSLVKVVFSEESKCTSCMSCEKACPTNALKIDSREFSPDLCIWCNACARACPEGVFSFHWVKESSAYFEQLDKVFGSRKEPTIFL